MSRCELPDFGGTPCAGRLRACRACEDGVGLSRLVCTAHGRAGADGSFHCAACTYDAALEHFQSPGTRGAYEFGTTREVPTLKSTAPTDWRRDSNGPRLPPAGQ